MHEAENAEFLSDIETLSIMQLRQKYSGEANSHNNMKARVKTQGAKVHDDLQSFVDFLRHVGPKPTKKATLDRIDNNDPEYAPGKVRWADKQTQNSNKSDNLIFNCLKTGSSYTASQLAMKQQVTPTAIRNRRRNGWTDAEIIAGHRIVSASLGQPKLHSTFRSKQDAPLSAAEIQFMRDRESCEWHRKVEGQEYFICTPAELQQECDDIALCQGENWLQQAEEYFLQQKLPKWWKQYKPHIRFNDLLPFQQAWILRIDPSQGSNIGHLENLKDHWL